MNTLDVQEVLDALDEIVERKLHDQAQLERLQASIQKIIHLDSLQGEGGEAIKDHFATLHLPVLAAFQLFIGQYIEQLKQIRSNLLNFESSSALIREEFLADVKNGLDRVERYAIEDATAIESIRASIADLLPLPPFSMEPVLRYAQQGKDHVRVTAERLGNLDEANETVLASAKSTLQELTTVVSQVANWTSGDVIASPETQAEINANMEELYQNVVTQALQMAPLDRSHVEGREGDLYQDVLPLEFLYTGAYAPLYSGLKAANWYYLNHFPVSAILSNEQALQACRAPAMGATHAVTPAYFPLFARLSTLPANATVSPVILTRQLKQLVPIQYQWYQAQLRTQAIQTDTSQVVTTPGYMFTDQEVAAINTYLENNPPNEERLNENPVVAGVVDFFFGDFLTLADPEASLGEKALATTFILVKPAKVGEVVYDLSKARKVKTGGSGNRRVSDDIIRDGSHLGKDGTLKPNVKYQAGEYNYQYKTDELGRLTDFNADDLKLTKRDNRLSHKSNTPGKEPGDHAGHLAADRFGGSPDLDNIVSQSSSVNLSKYKKLENQWAKAIEEGKDVSVNVKVNYEGNSLRPSSFDIEYEIDGRMRFTSIGN
ncbi:T7SS effector LXG polymorphic toxin [Shouchella clausii]|uniref:T7SS effector LXG polymorphic toxin n=2 Tax=Shouchella clausii TaxID=79880 RepID=UPI002898BA27|nr:T7SS effector LXG polymorphic toxin [Shouchella clausii]